MQGFWEGLEIVDAGLQCLHQILVVCIRMWRFNTACRQPEKLPGEGEEASTSSEEQPTCLDTSDFGKFLDVSNHSIFAFQRANNQDTCD